MQNHPAVNKIYFWKTIWILCSAEKKKEWVCLTFYLIPIPRSHWRGIYLLSPSCSLFIASPHKSGHASNVRLQERFYHDCGSRQSSTKCHLLHVRIHGLSIRGSTTVWQHVLVTTPPPPPSCVGISVTWRINAAEFLQHWMRWQNWKSMIFNLGIVTLQSMLHLSTHEIHDWDAMHSHNLHRNFYCWCACIGFYMHRVSRARFVKHTRSTFKNNHAEFIFWMSMFSKFRLHDGCGSRQHGIFMVDALDRPGWERSRSAVPETRFTIKWQVQLLWISIHVIPLLCRNQDRFFFLHLYRGYVIYIERSPQILNAFLFWIPSVRIGRRSWRERLHLSATDFPAPTRRVSEFLFYWTL